MVIGIAGYCGMVISSAAWLSIPAIAFNLTSGAGLMLILSIFYHKLLTVNQNANDALRAQMSENEHRACHDYLTGLPNRHYINLKLEQQFERHLTTNRMAAVFYIDLDGFKQVNDRYGHNVGDELIQIVAARLTAKRRSGDIAIRLGGDEFIVYIDDIVSTAHIANAAEHVLLHLSEPYHIDSVELTLSMTPSIGIAAAPRDGVTLDQLIRKADVAMYSQKRNGKNGICWYDDDMGMLGDNTYHYHAKHQAVSA